MTKLRLQREILQKRSFSDLVHFSSIGATPTCFIMPPVLHDTALLVGAPVTFPFPGATLKACHAYPSFSLLPNQEHDRVVRQRSDLLAAGTLLRCYFAKRSRKVIASSCGYRMECYWW